MRQKWQRLAAGLLALPTAIATVVVVPSVEAVVQEAQSDSSELSVGNLGEAGSTWWCSARSDWRCAQGFTTGSDDDGYALGSVTARFLDKAGSPGDVVVTLHASVTSTGNDGKRPGAVLATMTGANPDVAGDYTFACSGSGCSLAADTTYFVQFSSVGGADNSNEYRWKTVLYGFGEVTVPAGNGWKLADELDYRIGSGGWQAADDLAGYLRVNASPAPDPTPTLTAERNGAGAAVSWTAYGGDGFEYYRVIVCDDSQYDDSSCNGTTFTSDAFFDAGYTGPVTVTGLNATTGYGVILQVWRNGSALKIHATLPAPLGPPVRAGQPRRHRGRRRRNAVVGRS